MWLVTGPLALADCPQSGPGAPLLSVRYLARADNNIITSAIEAEKDERERGNQFRALRGQPQRAESAAPTHMKRWLNGPMAEVINACYITNPKLLCFGIEEFVLWLTILLTLFI